MAPGINIAFGGLSYAAKCGTFKKNEKIILKQINGEFRERELSVIMGPSGSGKSTLLNVLTGLLKSTSGSIKINGSTNTSIRNKSAYIMQDQNLYSLLSVRESMIFAIKFKTGFKYSKREQEAKCNSIINQLGLIETLDRFVRDLSGGQQKRLSIAIELVNDPRILFLDEPTTGLDASASTQCVHLLKRLAQEGRTIVCTIHTPSALLFKQFDHVYVLAEGKCIYRGSSEHVVPFLSHFDLICPASYNPADYLLEISNNDYGFHNHRLTKKINNGLNDAFQAKAQRKLRNNHELFEKENPNYASTFVRQLHLLILRNFLLMKRDKSLVTLRLTVSFCMAFFVSCLFFNIGNLASQMFNNYKYIYVSTHFLTYASFFSLMIRFPIDLPILRREHFNRWYCGGSYYLALSIADAPIVVIFCLIYNLITYYMSGQPLELFRITLVVVICIAISFTAQAFGLFAGSMFGLLETMIIAALLMVVHITFAGVLLLQKDAQPWMRWIFEIIFLKHGNDGVIEALLGYGREKFYCDQFFCQFQKPQTFLKMIGSPRDPLRSFYTFPIIFLAVHSLAFYNMNRRLKSTD